MFLDDLASLYEEWKYGTGKALSIVRSSSSIVSIVASALLVWILFRSRDGTKTTYHRLLLGLSASDILYSLSWATFGAVVPSELSYVVWNARGNRASCDAFGFLNTLAGFSGLMYMCSLNLYYLAKVKFNKTDYYIAKKLEPGLHGVPALYGLISSIVFLANQVMNASITSGGCSPASNYDPPHCDGYEDGDIPEGFEIPCGRGRSAEPITYGTAFITLFLVPITIGGSLWTIYRSVLRAERRIARYGAGALHTNRSQPTSNDVATSNSEGRHSGGRGAFMILSAVKRRVRGRGPKTSSNNEDSSQSRAVLHRAAAYSVSYFVTWIWVIIYGFLNLAGAWTTELPPPKWAIAYLYVWSFFQPLQGLWTFLIYMQPNVIKRKRSSDENVSWFRAFADALWLAVAGGNNSARRGRERAGPKAPRTAAAPGRRGTNPTPAPGPEERNTSATVGSTDQQGVSARDPGARGTGAAPGSSGTSPTPATGAEGTDAAAHAVPRENRLVCPEDEEEKREIEPYDEEEEKREIEPFEEDQQGGFAHEESVALEAEDAEEERNEIEECQPSV